MNYLVTEKYLEAQQKLGESDNAKILFMDPRNMSESLNNLMESIPDVPSEAGGGGEMKLMDTPTSQD
ncbi:hypothetical protein [Microcoleus vaginatus]|uniref:hypothetical protein n=1 Tax=Microcoleus vaginatus TaxID=119532 RepID=UPI00403F1276